MLIDEKNLFRVIEADELGELYPSEEIALIQYLYDNGLLWQLPKKYRRRKDTLIKSRLLDTDNNKALWPLNYEIRSL